MHRIPLARQVQLGNLYTLLQSHERNSRTDMGAVPHSSNWWPVSPLPCTIHYLKQYINNLRSRGHGVHCACEFFEILVKLIWKTDIPYQAVEVTLWRQDWPLPALTGSVFLSRKGTDGIATGECMPSRETSADARAMAFDKTGYAYVSHTTVFATFEIHRSWNKALKGQTK